MQVAAAVARLGGLDVLVNNAGIGATRAPAELPPSAEVRRQLKVNLLAAWSTTAAALPALEESRVGWCSLPAAWRCCPCRSRPPTG